MADIAFPEDRPQHKRKSEMNKRAAAGAPGLQRFSKARMDVALLPATDFVQPRSKQRSDQEKLVTEVVNSCGRSFV